ncbi:MAG: hypothetical protein RIE86_09245 [Imperialibacter sp.]|uniref:hypothetical protein n=1 Tax=Imperialibacter sp. TaxID=2038411 RepID=UPI0032EB7FD2
MENLTKENFFDGMMIKYPDAMKIFCDWIDEYKKRVNWKRLFNSDSNWQDEKGKNAPAPKFHDLPIAMQYGVWLHFLSDHDVVCGNFDIENLSKSLRNEIEEWMSEIESSNPQISNPQSL